MADPAGEERLRALINRRGAAPAEIIARARIQEQHRSGLVTTRIRNRLLLLAALLAIGGFGIVCFVLARSLAAGLHRLEQDVGRFRDQAAVSGSATTAARRRSFVPVQEQGQQVVE